MQHIGNDLIDLDDPHARGKNRDWRFIDRVFTRRESGDIETATEKDRRLWTLWSAKEAAYKVIRKNTASARAIPRQYEVTLSAVDPCHAKGTVKSPWGQIPFAVTMTKNALHCIACDDPVVMSSHAYVSDIEICPAGKDPSRAVRTAAISKIAELLHTRANSIEIRRTQGPLGLLPPVVVIDGIPAAFDISLSHDGRFIAYAVILPLNAQTSRQNA